MKRILYRLRMLPLPVVMGLIFFLSHQSGSSLELPPIPLADKLAHALIYGILAWAALLALPADTRNSRPGLSGLSVVLFCLLYGISDEFHQSFIPGRDPSLADLAADVAGSICVVMLWYRRRRNSNALQPSPGIAGDSEKPPMITS